ncbi:MAG: PAS domain S-box protein [Firmicutes bacterium]|jgi:two-component system sensor histidine kinase VicK|nr:PAS domain S-box protein [Bacillota bacterium]
MFKTKLGRSIRWKLVLVYVLLVFIATTIIGVFLTSQLEKYYTNSIRQDIENTVNEGALTSSFAAYDTLAENVDEIAANIHSWGIGLGQEIYVIDSAMNIIAATSDVQSRSALDLLDCDVILSSLSSGEEAESFSTVSFSNRTLQVMNVVFPVISDSGKTLGVLYFRADMSEVDESVAQSGSIFIRAMILALVITVVLGIIISSSITGPIKDVTVKAERMSEGDFSQEVSIKSDDEIGQLANMFNILRIKLNDTLSQIENEKNKLEAVLRHMADALIAIDLAGNITHLNQAAIELLGLPEDYFSEGEQLPYDDLISTVNKDLRLEKLVENCREEAATDVFEYGGRTFAVRYDKYRDEGGEDIGILMIIQDITERQKLENMQMDFVANVSHELKTPLTTIKSYTETMLDGMVDDPAMQKQFLGIIDTEADRMNRLVKELLQLSRMENQQEQWSMKELNIIPLLQNAVTKVELTAAAKKQQLNILFKSDERLPVVVDRDKIEQVVLNILSNSIKYTQEGGRIDVDALRREKTVYIIVSDNGIGIPEEELGRVFERFFRVDKARSRAMGGTGLGLSISKQIVDEHGGNIEIESKEGRGTKVTISLPLAASALRGERLSD